MRSRRWLALVALLSLVVTACSDSGDPASAGPDPKTWRDDIKGTDLEIGVLSAEGTPGLELLQGLTREIAADHKGANISLTFANTEARPGIEQRWRAGNPLDVDYDMFDATDPEKQVWADDGALLDLKPYLEQEDPETGKPWLESFIPTVRKFMEYKGGIYGVPSELSVHVLFYNAKLFSDLGIEAPKTWDDLTAAADKLKAGGVDPIALTGLFEPYMAMGSDHLWLRTVGYDKARAVLRDGKGHITDEPGFLQGLEMLQDLRDKGAFLKGFAGTDFTAAQAQFFQGKAGMILMGSWLVSEMADVIPKDFQLGVVAFPTVEGGKGDQGAVMATLQQMAIAAESENIPLSLEWARRLTSVEFQTKRANEIGEVSAVTGVPSPPGIPGIDKVIENAESLNPRDYGMFNSPAKEVVYPEISKLLYGKQDAKATLDALDDGLRRFHKN